MSTPPTDSELVEPTTVDGAILAVVAAAFVTALGMLALGGPPGDAIIATAVMGCAGLIFNLNRRLAAVLHRRTKRRTSASED